MADVIRIQEVNRCSLHNNEHVGNEGEVMLVHYRVLGGRSCLRSRNVNIDDNVRRRAQAMNRDLAVQVTGLRPSRKKRNDCDDAKCRKDKAAPAMSEKFHC